MGSAAVVTMLESMREVCDDPKVSGMYAPAALMNARRWLSVNMDAAERGARSIPS